MKTKTVDELLEWQKNFGCIPFNAVPKKVIGRWLSVGWDLNLLRSGDWFLEIVNGEPKWSFSE